ncbi:MAG: RNA-directed DNA polymerase [Planctomycetales bacterium]|nr:RNA-directed DNA polymerase [Planctomycetales bacterium]
MAATKSSIPAWAYRPLPLNAQPATELIQQLDKLEQGLPGSSWEILRLVGEQDGSATYEAVANRAMEIIWTHLDECIANDPHTVRQFAASHLPIRVRNRVLRRLAIHPSFSTRRSVRYQINESAVREVALPSAPDGEWNAEGWLLNSNSSTLMRPRKLKAPDPRLPKLKNVKAVMKELGIVSNRQLGWMLLATDEDGGPYHTFEIGKRNGKARKICAPCWQLRRVQQRILHNILDHLPPHPAAHGFVKGRSVVTNAAPHLGKPLLLKFDLLDFFPTIHYHRVIGLFASMGYGMTSPFFDTENRSRNVAPVLARLCTYTEDPRVFRDGTLPQGAPTSPAISNLICRRLDARLDGLARKHGAAYTRYADDLTFSFDQDEISVGRFRWWVDQICHQEGFLVHQAKFRAIRSSQRQSVTGVVVNERMRVPRDLRRRFRAILHNCRKRGVAAEARGDAGFPSYLLGMASYMYMVNPDEGGPVLDEVRKLLAEQGN